MKKIFVLMLALACFMSLSVSAYEEGGCAGDVPEIEGTIAIDGAKDDLYENALQIMIASTATGNSGENIGTVNAYGTAYLVFGGTTLYVYIDVVDNQVVNPDPNMQKLQPWATDSVEVFIDTTNEGMIDNVTQYRVDCSGYMSVLKDSDPFNGHDDAEIFTWGVEAEDYFKGAGKKTDTGYAAEFALPLNAEATQIGICMSINDLRNDGTYNYAQNLSLLTGQGPSAWNIGWYPYVNLGVTETPATDAPATEDPATDTPATEAPAQDTEGGDDATDAATDGAASTTAGTAASTEATESKGGCGGAISAAALLVCALGAVAVLPRKRED